jgi:hypothetical protein
MRSIEDFGIRVVILGSLESLRVLEWEKFEIVVYPGKTKV